MAKHKHAELLRMTENARELGLDDKWYGNRDWE